MSTLQLPVDFGIALRKAPYSLSDPNQVPAQYTQTANCHCIEQFGASCHNDNMTFASMAQACSTLYSCDYSYKVWSMPS